MPWRLIEKDVTARLSREMLFCRWLNKSVHLYSLLRCGSTAHKCKLERGEQDIRFKTCKQLSTLHPCMLRCRRVGKPVTLVDSSGMVTRHPCNSSFVNTGSWAMTSVRVERSIPRKQRESKAVHTLNNVLALEGCSENKSIQDRAENSRLDHLAHSSTERTEGHWETKDPNTEHRIISDSMLPGPVDMQTVRFVRVGVRKRERYG